MKRIFITGITGTLGTALARHHVVQGDRVYGCARNEGVLVKWKEDNLKCEATPEDAHLIPFARYGSLDVLYHCAALKHVEVCETNVEEAIRQNVDLVRVVARACYEGKVRRGIFISSDKAVNPTGVYGCTKRLGENIALKYGHTVVRLGNVIGSSGSVFQKWARTKGDIHLTDPDCTRYFITVKDAVEFITEDARWAMDPPFYPRDMKSARMLDVALGITRSINKVLITGLRPGETVHQHIAPHLSSKDAPKWNVDELLKEAGVRS